MNASPAPGKWSIREIVAHLADCEMVFGFRLRQTLAVEHAVIQPFDQEVWAERYGGYDFASALGMFVAARNWNLKLLGTVSEKDQHRPTTHPERGTMIFWTIVETMAGHDVEPPGADRADRLVAEVAAGYSRASFTSRTRLRR